MALPALGIHRSFPSTLMHLWRQSPSDGCMHAWALRGGITCWVHHQLTTNCHAALLPAGHSLDEGCADLGVLRLRKPKLVDDVVNTRHLHMVRRSRSVGSTGSGDTVCTRAYQI